MCTSTSTSSLPCGTSYCLAQVTVYLCRKEKQVARLIWSKHHTEKEERGYIFGNLQQPHIHSVEICLYYHTFKVPWHQTHSI